MSNQQNIDISVIGSLADISAQEWDACACPEAIDGRPTDPFTTHRFLSALEESGSVGEATGWEPRHLIARLGGDVVGVMPLYGKGHSQGEYVFDHAWADAYERAGGHYYPKLQAAVPFTPATGRRFLVRREGVQAALIQGAIGLAERNQVSSIHVTFCTEAETIEHNAVGLLHRLGQQFHWYNQDYADYSAFLAQLSSRKRKALRKERRIAQGFGGRIVQLTGTQIQPEHWAAFWHFYQDTGRRKWGRPYLTREFFDIVQRDMRDDVLLVMCKRNGHWVAGALNFIGKDTLYGRYWGCIEDHPSLHFEVCYHQAIDFAIAHGLARVEAGAQGEHKLARGYLPTPVHSLHWIADSGFRQAVAQYLDAERVAVDEDIEVITTYGPFRKVSKDS